MPDKDATIISVAVRVPAFKLFSYAAPVASGSLLGRRVLVEFGGRRAVGLVMSEGNTQDVPAHVKIKPVLEVYSDMPPLPAATLDLIQFCASYYHAPIGIAAAAALPAVFRRSSVSQLATGWRRGENAPVRGSRALQVWEFLQNRQCRTAEDIQRETGASSAVLRRMEKTGSLKRDFYFPPPSGESPDALPDLTPDQQLAVEATDMGGGYAPHLLFGDTGAGKTEVYLRLTETALAAGGRALILTPEIHLTPQLEMSFTRRFPDRRVCVLHSGLTDGERARRWLMARLGAADVVLGTRLAVFTPLADLRLIVVDEEHDDSYKQEEGLLFSARDVAVWRARREGATLVCGSATPSLESYENARRNRYKLLRMNSRARQGQVKKALAKEEGALFHGMSQQFLSELAEALANGQQALVFVNRRGYSPMLACQGCGWSLLCSGCEAKMTWHKRRGKLVCHRCGASAMPPLRCSNCRGQMRAAGIGTQRIEEALNSRFAPLTAVRLDRDSLSGRDSFAELREKISSGQAQLLVGTQIVAKGHDFPHLSFIGVLNADAGLWSADFRAEERLLMLLRQVIGRGTRRLGECRALIQTAYPDHPFYRDLLTDNLEECWRRIAEERKRAQLPPFAHCALLRASSVSQRALQKFFISARKSASDICPSEVQLFDAAPAPAAKIAGRIRVQLLVQSASRTALHRFLTHWRQTLPPLGEVRWNMDVDPLQI